ncbi:ComEC/Rec2 family competence protein [Tropicimonas sp. IMCC34043]|uniref:ComEC/Rec2 family competence protein n=1 Tax=Tropicimonas sp. IMCC34043 TaxID=2248760 RepID=UPI000E267552|nr:ComEC/Rec2 family competence protein [Tropicimonas sp. IMCC34043]
MTGAMLAQRGFLLPWVPVFLGVGIGIWFSLPVEPGAAFYAAAAAATIGLGFAGRRAGEAWAPLVWALSLVLAGSLLAGLRAHSVAAPVLGFRYYGAIEGRVVDIDRSASDAPRLTLDRVVMEDMSPARTPALVRVSLHGDQDYVALEPGLTVILTGHLSPPNGPVEPGGFDFRRLAWFDRLGAVGYVTTPVLALIPARDGQAGLQVFRLRMAFSAWLQRRIAGQAGALAAAILAGDRSGLDRPTIDTLRNSNLAHLLAISGLHMGLLTGVVFATLRAGMALIPWLALRFPIKKIAALGALTVGAGYLALSGGSVSTQRAFVMIAVMFGAVLLEKRAVSLRSVAIAALLLLLFRPEALLGAGFQMSFAATTALVAAFGWLRDRREGLPQPPRWLAPVLAVVISSAVAGAATAPFSAAHFNRLADYGLLANLLSVPVMGAVVMPAAVATALLWPFGLAGIGLWVLQLGLDWILTVAARVAAIEGAVSHVPAPGPAVLPAIAAGFLVVILWQGRWRWLGVLGILAGLALWPMAERPAGLIADTGGLVGVLGPEGRALSKPRGDSYAALAWLENDGDGADQEVAFARPGFSGEKGDLRASLGGVTLRVLGGRGVRTRLGATCGPEIVVMSQPPDRRPDGPCVIFDPEALRKTGAVALFNGPEALRIVTVAERAGQRLWTSRQR